MSQPLLAMLTAFQDINRAIPGIVSAPDPSETPQDLTALPLPAALTLPGPASWHGRVWKATRAYVVRVYVAAADTDAGAAFGLGIDLIEAVGETYHSLHSRVNEATLLYSDGGGGLSDSGFLRTIPYAGVDYYGFELTVTVKEPN